MQVHRGQVFDVHQVRDDAGTWALKVPAAARQPGRDCYAVSATVGGVSTVWNLVTQVHAASVWSHLPDIMGQPLPSWDPQLLLDDEAARIRATHGAWNHEVRSVGPVVTPDGTPAYGLCTRWCEGTPLGAMPRPAQRALWPRLLPALWDALAAAAHGDLHGDNLIVESDRFALIDPGAMVESSSGESCASSGARTISFITHATSYPVLPPYLWPGDDRDLASAWQRFVSGSTFSGQYPAMRRAGGAVSYQVGAQPHLYAPRPAGRPLPADLLAVGVLYYQALTNSHPWPIILERGPAWAGLDVQDDHVTGHEIGEACVEQAPRRPSAYDFSISAGEDALALALLGLTIGSRDELVDRVAGVLRGR